MRTYVILVFFCSLLLTFLLFLPFSLHIADHVVNSGDPLHTTWILAHNTYSILHGFTNLLDTNIFYPTTDTLAFSDTQFAQTIGAAPIIYLTHNPLLAQNISMLLTFPLAAVAMYLLSYWITKNHAASVLSGLFYAFSYPRLVQINHVPSISSQWIPLWVLFFLKFLKSGTWKDLLICIAFYLLTMASTLYYGVYSLLWGIAIGVGYYVVMRKRNTPGAGDRMKKIALISIPVLISVVILLYPYILLKVKYPDTARGIDELVQWSAVPSDYLNILPTSLLHHFGMSTNANERALYPTITVVILAIAVWFTGWRNRWHAALFTSLAFLSFVLSLGPYNGTTKLPYYFLYYIFPPLEAVRVPSRINIYFILALSVLAACSISSIGYRFSKTVRALVYGG